jgi:hypothetical protein
MKRSTRILIGGLVIELLLAGIAAWLFYSLKTGAIQPTNSAAETGSVIGSTLGGAMGAIGGLLIVMYIIARLKERNGG